MSLVLVPITLTDAIEFVRQNHRHHQPPPSGLFAVACANGEGISGVAIVGRPVARMLQDGWTAEVIRLCTDGSRNACSLLYGASWRAARALGYRRLITYTLPEEGGQAFAEPAGNLSARPAAEAGIVQSGPEWIGTRRRENFAGSGQRDLDENEVRRIIAVALRKIVDNLTVDRQYIRGVEVDSALARVQRAIRKAADEVEQGR